MTDNKMVSVVIPVHNTEKYLKRCYLSVINQTYPNIEVVLINDASMDDSDTLIQLLMKTTNGRTIHYNKFCINQGLSAVRNFGLCHANGDYISFLDSDDWYDSDFLSKMIASLESTSGDVAVCGIRTEHNNYCSSSIRYFYETTATIVGDYALKLLSRAIHNNAYITPMVGNKVFRKQFLTNCGLTFPLLNTYEDDVFSFLVFAQSPSVVLVSDTSQHYYQHENSITHSFSKQRIDNLIDAFVLLKAELRRKNLLPRYTEEYMAFFDRCITTTYDDLIAYPLGTYEKKKYIAYFLERLIANFSIGQVVEYLDIERFHRFMGII